MGRKNRRSSMEYRDCLGFDPNKYISHSCHSSYGSGDHSKYDSHSSCGSYSHNSHGHSHNSCGSSSHNNHSSHSSHNSYQVGIDDCRNTAWQGRSSRSPHRGEVWFVELGHHGNTSVQGGCRPVLIISNDEGNHHADTICVLPMTTRLKKGYLPSHVEISQENLAHRDYGRHLEPSMILAEQITTISKSALRSYLGIIGDRKKLEEINRAVREQLNV